jgi:hypothetical protein
MLAMVRRQLTGRSSHAQPFLERDILAFLRDPAVQLGEVQLDNIVEYSDRLAYHSYFTPYYRQ